MISLTRLNGDRIAVNADLIERAEETPDTVLTLTNGTKYVVAESLDELLERIALHKAGVIALAAKVSEEDTPAGNHRLRLLAPVDRRAVVELQPGDDDVLPPTGVPGGGEGRR